MDEQFVFRVPADVAEQLNQLLEDEGTSGRQPELELEFERESMAGFALWDSHLLNCFSFLVYQRTVRTEYSS